MKLYFVYIILIIMISNCTIDRDQKFYNKYILSSENGLLKRQNFFCYKQNRVINTTMYDQYIHRYSKFYRIDSSLVKAIIQVESNYNPNVISKSNAIGLMQIKADTAGKDVYRIKGWTGKPSICDLKNASTNIECGVIYLSILQNQLKGIINLKTRRYAMIVAYVNGLEALLRIFSIDRVCAINKINKLSSNQFYRYIQNHHPSGQAQRYLSKVNSIYMLIAN